MPILVAIPFYVATAAYIAAACLALLYLREPDSVVLDRAKRTAAVGNVLLALVFGMRWAQWGLLPLTGFTDSLNLFLILCTGIVLTVQRENAMKPLLVYYLPALSLLAILSACVAHKHLGESPKALNSAFLTFHVGLVFFAFALFFVASLTSMGYMSKASHLKRHNISGFYRQLPSLEQLDRTLYRLISVGYPMFVVTLILGFVWAYFDRELLGPAWFVSPKILISLVIVVLYAVSFHTRRFGLLRGPKLAYLVFFGFTGILIAYLGLNLFDAAKGSFWGPGS